MIREVKFDVDRDIILALSRSVSFFPSPVLSLRRCIRFLVDGSNTVFGGQGHLYKVSFSNVCGVF